MIALLALVTLAGLATGTLVGRFMNRRPLRRPASALDAERSATGAGAPDPRFRTLPCALGDVVLLAHGEEAWLESALLFRERAADADEAGDTSRTVSALFLAPDRGRDRAVFARAAPDASLDWLWPLPVDAIAVGSEPPSAIEYEGERFERTRRIPLTVVGVGAAAPELGESAVVAEYEGGAGVRLLVVLGSTATRVWRGRRLEAGMYEVLPGGA